MSVIDFAESYTFAAKKEIQSKYYHFDQVSIFVHALYRHSQQDVDGIESTCENRDVIKEYQFISAMIVHIIHILFNIVLKFFSMIH